MKIGQKFICEKFNYSGTVTNIGEKRFSYKRNDNEFVQLYGKTGKTLGRTISAIQTDIAQAKQNFETGFWKEI